LDCDREGENIGFEVMENCEPKMAPKHEVYRARFSAITPQDVNKAMATLGRPNKNEALSVDARREIDLKVGVAFTRYQTTTFHFRFADLDAHLISYGPCQTPTLGFVVDRYDEIQKFRPTPYFKLVAHINRSGVKAKLKWQRGRVMKDRSVCVSYQSKMTAAGAHWATVTDVKTSKSKFPRPIPLNTVALMKAASTQLGLGPQQGMHIAEHLYINGWISYPRTESSAYPEHFDIHEVIEQHIKHPEWGHVARTLMETGLQRAKAGVDHGDHPPITPMACAVRDRDLTGSEWRVYEYIACHFIATVCSDAVIENQTVVYEIGGEFFTSSGSSLVEKGFLEVMPWAKPADKYMSSVKGGEQFPVESITIKEGMTKPPTFISESELISLMEKHGIGTDASIPTHIENIQRSYVKLHERTRTLEPNKLGIALVHGYHRIDPELVLPKVRANIEDLVSKIALGQATYESVLQGSLQTFLEKYDHFVSSISKIDELFEASFSSLGDVQVNTRLKPKCGKCERFMKYIDAKPHRLYCVNCEEVYSMPKDGSLKSDGNAVTCPLDGFELVVHTDRKGKTTRLCPKCFNTPEYPGMKAGSNCAQCPNTACAYNLAKFTVEDHCPACDVGFLAIEPNNGRRIDCNLCGYFIALPQDANKITASKIKCDKCTHKSTKIHFKYAEKNNPQPEKSHVEFDACIRCDPVMAPLVKVKIPGVKDPRKFESRRGGRGREEAPTVSSTAAPSGPSKPSETQFYSASSIAAIMGGKKSASPAPVEEEEDYETYETRGRGRRGRKQLPERAAPAGHTFDLMDHVIIHKTSKGAKSSATAATSLQQKQVKEDEWEQYDPSALEDVIIPNIEPPHVNTFSNSTSHLQGQGRSQGGSGGRQQQQQSKPATASRQQNQVGRQQGGHQQAHGKPQQHNSSKQQQNNQRQPRQQGRQQQQNEDVSSAPAATQPQQSHHQPRQSQSLQQQQSQQMPRQQRQQKNQGPRQNRSPAHSPSPAPSQAPPTASLSANVTNVALQSSSAQSAPATQSNQRNPRSQAGNRGPKQTGNSKPQEATTAQYSPKTSSSHSPQPVAESSAPSSQNTGRQGGKPPKKTAAPSQVQYKPKAEQ
jgi:DNA topoisomerase-3